MAKAPTTGEEFLQVVEKSQLLAPSILKQILPQIEALGDRFSDPDRMAKLMVRSDLITPYQSKHLLQGRTAGFYFGKCKILEVLGRGGMGTVYLAEQITMHRLVAVKVVRRIVKSKSDTIARFTREAHAVASLRHSNIVQAFDFDHADGVPYIVMEHIEGLSANQLVEKLGPIPFAQAADIVMQCAAGLEHAHQNSMVHRDVKPGNVMIDSGGVVKLLDLGLCTMCEKNNDSLTTDDDQLGTVDYIAPEQAMDSHNADIRADIYSLGAVFYYLLSGQILYPDASTAQKLIYCQTAKPTPLSKLVPDVPPQLETIISKMLSKDPNDRYQTPSEVIKAVEGFAVRRVPPFDRELIEKGRDDNRRYLRRSPALSTIRATSALPMDGPPSGTGGKTTGSLSSAIAPKATSNIEQMQPASNSDSQKYAVDDPSTITGELSEVNGTQAADSSGSSWTVEQLSKIAQKLPERMRKSKTVQALTVGSLLGLAYFGSTMFFEQPGSTVNASTGDAALANLQVDVQDQAKPETSPTVTPNGEEVTPGGLVETVKPELPPVINEGPQSPLDKLSRNDITPYELGVAANYLSQNAPFELVSIFGDSRMKHWNEAWEVIHTPDKKELISLV